MFTTWKPFGISIFAAGLTVASLPAQAFIIDDFNAVSGAVANGLVTPGTASSDQQPGETILGGERDLRADFSGGNTFESVVVSTGNNIVGSGGVPASTLVHSVGGNSRGTSLIVYDGNDDDAGAIDFAGLGGIDGTSGGADNGLRIDVIESDRPIPITAYVFTSATQWSFFTFNTPTNQITDPMTGFLVPAFTQVMEYGSFTSGADVLPTLVTGDPVPLVPNTLATSGADFTNINAIALLIDSSNQTGIDLTFDLLATNNIPVPGSVLLLAPALLLLRKRRQS